MGKGDWNSGAQASRRTVLKSLALGPAAIAATANLMSQEAASAATSESSVPTTTAFSPDGVPTPIYSQATVSTTFLTGIVQSIGNDQIVMAGQVCGQVTLDVTVRTQIWREQDANLDSIRVGDFLYVKAQPTSTGVEALQVWANIGNYDGTVKFVASDVVAIQTSVGQRDLYITNRTLVFSGESPGRAFTGQLQVGQAVKAIGRFVPGGHMRVTRMWVS